MAMRFFEKKDLDISAIPNERVEAFNKSIAKGNKPAGRISPMVGVRKVSIRANRKKNDIINSQKEDSLLSLNPQSIIVDWGFLDVYRLFFSLLSKPEPKHCTLPRR